MQAILAGKQRALLTLATGTGKSFIAFQITWKLWNAKWTRTGEKQRHPRILFLADRTVLVDDPHDNEFAPLGSARHRIQGSVELGREVYFATYQTLTSEDATGPLFKKYPAEFFDLVIVDEAHRGSARDDSSWRAILEHFSPAYQLGMTATPLREDSRDTYAYFGNPIYQYSLRQGIEDGFLAPYKVFRVKTEYDEFGYRVKKGITDKRGKEIPEGVYQTKDFERFIVLSGRTEAIAKHLTAFLKKTDRFAKTIVFCVNQDHALAMRQALVNENSDLMKQYPDYVCRVTSDEDDIGRGHLGRFQKVDTKVPTILTTSQMLTTGVNAPTCRNVVEFKQIIGRGTRVREDCGKLFFNILDYAGSASERFSDPEFDGYPASISEEVIDGEGETVTGGAEEPGEPPTVSPLPPSPVTGETQEKYFPHEKGGVKIVAEIVQELDVDGNVLRTVQLTDYAAEKARTLCTTPEDMKAAWTDATRRREILEALSERGIDFHELAEVMKRPDADPFDLLCHVAFNQPLKTRKERADAVRKQSKDFFEEYGPTARVILEGLLEKYTDQGPGELRYPDVLSLPPLDKYGNSFEIMQQFGGKTKFHTAVHRLESLLYTSV